MTSIHLENRYASGLLPNKKQVIPNTRPSPRDRRQPEPTIFRNHCSAVLPGKRRTLGRVTTALPLLFCFLATACASHTPQERCPRHPSATDELPIPAHEPTPARVWEDLRAEYGVVEGAAARLMVSGKAKELIATEATEKVEFRRGMGHDELLITEFRVQGVPVRLRLKGKEYDDPLLQFDTDDVVRITYGFEALGVQIDERNEISAVIDAIRNETFSYYQFEAFLPYRGPNGAAIVEPEHGGGGQASGGGSVPPVLKIHFRNSTTINIWGHAALGHVFSHEPNAALAEVFRRVFERSGLEPF